MPYRKISLVKGQIYHIFNKSIADFKIFNRDEDYKRMYEELSFYSIKNPPCSFSIFKKFKENPSSAIFNIQFDYLNKLVDIIAYCIMPTHIHLMLKELKGGGISKFLNLILHSYTNYFNLKHKRKGPLWEGRFGNVLIENDDQFIHVTRYIHLNPVTAHLVDKPEHWQYSSYREYIGQVKGNNRVCNYSGYVDIDIASYVKFVNDQVGYQRELALIKHLALE